MEKERPGGRLFFVFQKSSTPPFAGPARCSVSPAMAWPTRVLLAEDDPIRSHMAWLNSSELRPPD